MINRSHITKKYVIFDLDGTIADIELRRKKAMRDNGRINWSIFFDPRNIPIDKPLSGIVELYHAMIMAGHTVVVFSGRSDITRDATMKWFFTNDINTPHILKMRIDGDFSPDQDLKRNWLAELLETEQIELEDILFVVDDRKKVVEMWRELDLLCLHCAEGDF